MCAIRRIRIFLFCLSLPAFPQDSPTPPKLIEPSRAPTSPARSAVNRRITLDVVVAEKSEKPVTGLQQDDFTIVDNKQPQKILSFQAVEGATDPPPEVILVVDRVNTDFQNAANEREELKKFLRLNGGQLPVPVSMIFFSDTGTKTRAATRDGNALIAALDDSDSALRTSRRSQGFYGALERFQLSGRTLNSIATFEEATPGKKLLIWLSPGWPILTGPRIDLSSKDRQGLFSNVVAISSALTQARTTVYSVDPLGMADAGGFRTTDYKLFLKGVKSARQVEMGNLALQVFAIQGGGRVFNSSNDIASEIAKCMGDANAYYVLSFDSPPADGPDEYHALDVKVDKPGLIVRTRTGYYAQP
jgi:VWFA-related protein